jgi:hypothetical protein
VLARNQMAEPAPEGAAGGALLLLLLSNGMPGGDLAAVRAFFNSFKRFQTVSNCFKHETVSNRSSRR